ncbi:MAG: hypothetical protein ABSG77_04735 [Candidatus Acidiferrum sp.]
MNAFKINLRVVAFVTVVLCCGLSANAQSVTVSPGNLSFGVPIGTTMSAPEAVNISVSGSGNTLTVTNVGITVNNEATGTTDFAQTNTCSGTISAPGYCTVSVTFTPSAPAGTLESATLNVTYTTGVGGGNGSTTANVPLTGAFGAIRLFDPVNVANSNGNATLSSLVTFDSTTLTLSCPASPTAVVSSSPNGSGYVVVDNFLTLFVGPNPPTQTTAYGLIGNVCPANLGNPSDVGQADCFTSAYQGPAGANSLDGQDPDTFASPGNSNATLGGAAGGVPPIDVSGPLVALGQGQATFSLLDGGGKVTSTTLFLVTSCSLTNANTGTETGNSVSQQPSQTLNFDTVVNDTDEYSFDYSFVPVGSITNPNATPIVTNNSITPAEYSALVLNTPFVNTSCIPLASLGGNCALKTQVCAPLSPSTAPAAGIYCPQTSAPDFLFTATFDPVAPITTKTTFGFLEFNDAGSCPLEGPEANSSCPQNGLVSFSGPGINTGGRGAGSTNSSSIVVAGVTPPTTTVAVTPFFTSGSTNWTNASPTVTFTGNPAALTSYVAPINFIEYGVNPTSQGLPPTFPIPFPGNSTFSTDTTFTAASCPSTIPALPIPPSFGPESATLGPYANGASNLLHYSTTDCAATHELQFTLTNGSWSTSWKSLTLQTDTQYPAINITAPAASTAYPAYQKVKAAYTCTDTESGVASCTGTLPVNSYIDTTPTNGLSTPKSFTVNAVDNVGNVAPSLTVNYSVSCNYAAVGISPSTAKRPALVNITTSVIDCMSAPQNVKVRFSVSGPIGKNCSNASSVLLTTPTFTIKSGTSNSITFPFPIAKNACAGSYTVTTTTLQGSTTIDTVNSTLTVQ